MNDEDLRDRLRAMADDTAAHTSLGDPGRIRRTATRRRQAVVGAAAAGVLAIAVGGWALASGPTTDRGLTPVHTPTTSTTTTATSAPTTPAEPPPGFPPQVRMPHELRGEEGWKEAGKDLSTWVLDPCFTEQAYTTDGERTRWAADKETAILEHVGWEQLAQYPDAENAAAAVEEMRERLRDCPFWEETSDIGQRSTMAWEFDELDPWPGTVDEVLRVWGDYEAFNPPYALGGAYLLVVRIDSLVLLVGEDGETDWSRPSAVLAQTQEYLGELGPFLDLLCRNSDGC